MTVSCKIITARLMGSIATMTSNAISFSCFSNYYSPGLSGFSASGNAFQWASERHHAYSDAVTG